MLKIAEDVTQRHVYKCVFIYLSIYLFIIDHFSDNSWLGNCFKNLEASDDLNKNFYVHTPPSI